MRIINRTQNTVLAENVIVANNFFRRLKGLLGTEALAAGEAMWIKPCNSVHTLFIRFPIDVIFVDRNLRVIKTTSGMKPFRLSGIYFRVDSVIELPSGIIQATRTHPNDTLTIE